MFTSLFVRDAAFELYVLHCMSTERSFNSSTYVIMRFWLRGGNAVLIRGVFYRERNVIRWLNERRVMETTDVDDVKIVAEENND